jgi:hypothetical protein
MPLSQQNVYDLSTRDLLSRTRSDWRRDVALEIWIDDKRMPVNIQ